MPLIRALLGNVTQRKIRLNRECSLGIQSTTTRHTWTARTNILNIITSSSSAFARMSQSLFWCVRLFYLTLFRLWSHRLKPKRVNKRKVWSFLKLHTSIVRIFVTRVSNECTISFGSAVTAVWKCIIFLRNIALNNMMSGVAKTGDDGQWTILFILSVCGRVMR